MNKVKVKVVSVKGVVWEGEGTSCSMANNIGPFDILVEHTQFVTPIQEYIRVRNNDQIVWEKTLETSAICRVKDNMVEIWLGI